MDHKPQMRAHTPLPTPHAPRSCRVAPIVEELPPSGIRKFFDLVQTMGDVVSLGVGEPDFATPWHICDALIYSLEQGRTSYTANRGMSELRVAIAQHIQRLYDLEYDPDREILITNGVSEGLDLALRAILEPGDGVLVPQPCYVSYPACVLLAGGVVQEVETRADEGFRLTPQALLERADATTRAVVIGCPNNPTGAALSRDDLLAIARVAEEHDWIMISDEIYDRLVYDGHMHTCFPTLPGMRDRTILLNGFSKAYAMTGLRLGYAAGPGDLIEAMTKIHQYTALCSSTAAQYGALEALRNGEKEVGRMLMEYDRRRRFFIRALEDLGLPCVMPRGTFYAFPSIRSTGLSSVEFCEQLLMEERVAVVPGTAFGGCGEGHIRATYANTLDQLKIAVERMGRFLARLRL